MVAPDPSAPPSRGLIDPQALARLRGVSLRARRVVDGVLQGLHRSPHQGASIEFAEHKEYAPGDEIRHVDWKAFGRFDKYYVKKFEHESNLRATFLIDASASMGYGAEGGLTKFEYSGVLATTMAYLMLRQQDAVGLIKFAEAAGDIIPPRSGIGHLHALARSLETTRVRRGTDLAAGLAAAVEQCKKRGLLYILSDFFADEGPPFDVLRQLVGRGHQVTVFHVLDGDELTFPFREMTLFEGMETRRRLLVEPHLVRKTYLKRIEAHQERIRRRCVEARAHYALVDTRQAPGDIVLRHIRAAQSSRGSRR